MKIRKGWYIVWSDGTEWKGDCSKWAEEGRRLGHKVIPIQIMGKRWPCGECLLHMH